MRWLALPGSVLVTAALLAGCSSDSPSGSGGGTAGGTIGTGTDGPPSSTDTDANTDTVADTEADTETAADTEAEDGSSSSSGGDEVDPLEDEGCESLPDGEQTPAAQEIAESIEAEIVALGREDDIALMDFGIKLGGGAGGVDIFCVTLALHADWFVSLESFCVQDTDAEVVLDEVSEALASAPSLPPLAPLADVEAAAGGCLGRYTYIPCRGTAAFLSPTFDPSILSFSTGEEVGDCTYTSTRVNLDSGTAEVLSCETDSNGTCDTEG